MNTQSLTILASLISLLGVCYLFFWRYRAFELAWFRQNLFEIRDDLFDYAEAGNLSFDHPAYGALRSCINGYIRFGDRMTIWHILFNKICSIGVKKQWVTFDEVFEHAQKGLHPDIIIKLDQFRNRMDMVAIRHCLLAAPEGTLIVVPPLFLVFAITTLIETHPASSLWKKFTKLDDTAYLLGDELAAA